VIVRPVGSDFFDVFDIPLLAGRVLGGEHDEDFPPRPAAAPSTPGPAAGPGAANGTGPRDPGGQGAGSQGATTQASSSGAAPPASTAQGSTPPSRPREQNIVVDRTFAAAFGFASPEAAVGQAVYLVPNALPGQPQPPVQTNRIVGVVEDRVFSMFGPQEINGVYYAAQRGGDFTVARVAKTDLATGLAAIDSMWKGLAPNVALTRRFLDDIFNNQYQYYVRISRLFGALALLAFVISIAGLFAMATLVAARRRQEVGVRKTLGARTRQIVMLLLASFAKPVVVANLVAWPVAFVAARIYLKQFPDPISLTPLPFVGSLVLMLAIACLAVGTQTWRAARLKPAEVLHHE
jgi:putative ABC transport system permease protein